MHIKTLCICAALVLVSGCSHEPLGVKPMGEAFRQQLYAQQVEPGYAAPTPVTGLNGKAAENVFGDYLTGSAGCAQGTESSLDSEQ